MSDPRPRLGRVGQVIDFEAWRRGRPQAPRSDDRDPLTRLEAAIERLGVLVEEGTGRIARRVESELLAITGAVTAGLVEEAADRAERLVARLEHPAARAERASS